MMSERSLQAYMQQSARQRVRQPGEVQPFAVAQCRKMMPRETRERERSRHEREKDLLSERPHALLQQMKAS